jgi:hypothetical protein
MLLNFQIDLHKLTGVNFISSHPVTDHDGTTYNIGTSFSTGPKYVVVRVPPLADGKGACESLTCTATYIFRNIPNLSCVFFCTNAKLR